MKDNFLLKQLAQAVVDSQKKTDNGEWCYCAHCDALLDNPHWYKPAEPHKPHCIVLVAEQILKGNEDE